MATDSSSSASASSTECYFAIGTQVVPLDLGPVGHFDIWLSYHRDAGKLARVRRMIDWTIDVFDPQDNPWFRDDLIRPVEFGGYQYPTLQYRIDAAFAHSCRR